jgi:hypothetical protein
MTGKFSATVLGQINAGNTTLATTSNTTVAAAAGIAASTSKVSASATSAKASSTASKPSSGASAGYIVPGSAVLAFVGVASYLVL